MPRPQLGYTPPGRPRISLSDDPMALYTDETAILWINHEGFGLGEVIRQMVRPPGTHGGMHGPGRAEAKVVTAELILATIDLPGLEALQDQLFGALFDLGAVPGVLDYTRGDGTALLLDCMLVEALPMGTAEGPGPFARRANVRFQSSGLPFWRDMAPSSVAVPFGLARNLFPLKFPLQLARAGVWSTYPAVNRGQMPTPVEISVRGPVTGPLVRNLTVNRSISFSALSVATGQTLFIDTSPYSRRVQLDGSDIWHLLDRDRMEFWDLERGTNNIEFDLGGTTPETEVTLRWHDRRAGG